MNVGVPWLSPLVLLEDFGGSWDRYEDHVYALFYRDFVEAGPVYEERSVRITRQLVKGKERTFWHCIQEGDIEEARTPDLRRCERICWVREVIENAADPAVRKWCNRRKGRTRQLLWLEDAEFLVVLEDRRTLWLLWTAYCTTYPHTKRKLRREYEASMK